MSTNSEEIRESMRVTAAAALLSVHRDTVMAWLHAGTLEGFQLPSGRWRVFRDAVVAMQRNGRRPGRAVAVKPYISTTELLDPKRW